MATTVLASSLQHDALLKACSRLRSDSQALRLASRRLVAFSRSLRLEATIESDHRAAVRATL
jgi:hypothetical protein